MSKNTLEVFWSDEFSPSAVTPALMYPLGERALASMDLPNFREFPAASIQRCPGFVGYYKNAFVVRSPVDITIHHLGEGRYEWETSLSNQQDIDGLIDIRDASGMMTIALFTHVWSEEELMVEQLPPLFLPGDVAAKCETVCGSFDISSWFRPLQPAFRFRMREAPDSIQIKRGDPLYLIRFATDKKISLRKFSGTEALRQLANQMDMVKHSTYDFHTSLLNYYQIYRIRKLNERIKKEILNSLIPG